LNDKTKQKGDMMLIPRTFFKFVIPLFIFPLFVLASCGRNCSLSKTDKVVAYVNREPIFASDLKRSMALKARQDPLLLTTPDIEQEQLDIMINRKLIIQEALRRGLARQDSFVQTIKTFWEQTLIREFIDFKKKEFQNYLYVTDNEIKKYYDNLGKQVTFKVLKSRDKRYVDDIYTKIKDNKPVETDNWDIIGPVGYDDITSNVLYEAFQLAEGESKIIEEAPYHYFVMVVNKQDIMRQPLETLQPQIEKQIRAIKEQRLFDEWLKVEREKAKVKTTKN
jgi:HPt (histidine-containing phosphotransfer) domain-containing protein